MAPGGMKLSRKKREVGGATASKPDWPKPGRCRKGLCGEDAGCLPITNETPFLYSCICTTDGKTATPDLKCPRKIVPLEPKPNPIRIDQNLVSAGQQAHNVAPLPTGLQNITATSTPPPSVSNSSIHSSNLPTFHALAQNPILQSVLVLTLATLALFTLCWCWIRCCYYRKQKKKKKKKKMLALPATLSNGLLTEERFTINPQYSPASLPEISVPIPLLSRESIQFYHEIGEGCFGKVYKGEIHSGSHSSDLVAVKVLKDGASVEAEEDLMREVEIMSAFKHPNILTLIGVVPREGPKNPWMVFEYMPYGDLAEVLRRNNHMFHMPQSHHSAPTITAECLCSIAEQIAGGMKYLAEQRFVHRDLAARNCLVGPPLVVKIADFGMSRDVYTCDYYKIGGSRLLPVRWMSPESVVYGRFTLESDVWSFGVVLWELYSYGKQPYYGHSNEEVLKIVLQGSMLKPPDDCPPFICDLMMACWKPEPRDRIKFSEIHKILTKAKDEFLFPASTLPRPPALPIATDHISLTLKEDISDAEDYTQHPVPPPGSLREYLQPLPDPDLDPVPGHLEKY